MFQLSPPRDQERDRLPDREPDRWRTDRDQEPD
jgi:hypothetical protein